MTSGAGTKSGFPRPRNRQSVSGGRLIGPIKGGCAARAESRDRKGAARSSLKRAAELDPRSAGDVRSLPATYTRWRSPSRAGERCVRGKGKLMIADESGGRPLAASESVVRPERPSVSLCSKPAQLRSRCINLRAGCGARVCPKRGLRAPAIPWRCAPRCAVPDSEAITARDYRRRRGVRGAPSSG